MEKEYKKLDFFLYNQEEITKDIKELANTLTLAEVLKKVSTCYTCIFKMQDKFFMRMTLTALSAEIYKKYFECVYCEETHTEPINIDF